MKLFFQDPLWPESTYLLEAILRVASQALTGAATYAFASPAGVKLLFLDPMFQRFLNRGRFDLVIGVDAVTNEAALELLEHYADLYPNLNCSVFLDQTSRGLFHPKICWFRERSKSQCLIGSSNLTAAGLRGNCEVFAATILEGRRKRVFEDTWAAWVDFHRPRLFPVDSPLVRAIARNNTGIEGATSRRRTLARSPTVSSRFCALLRAVASLLFCTLARSPTASSRFHTVCIALWFASYPQLISLLHP
jgi:hypothetical protein